ncbi:MAG: hypothetical protein Q7W13_13175 [Bacteroidia bacterium]|nr:hypothetical protein [Bacteroidia bacterium]
MSMIEHRDILEYIKKSRVTVSDLNEIIRAANKRLPADEPAFKVETLEDEQKINILQEVYKKYSLTQLARKLQL